MDEIIAVGAQPRYQIKMLLESFKDPFFYQISQEEFERISAVLDGAEALFLVFSTTDGRIIAAAKSAIQVANLLWEHGLPELEITKRLKEMRMYFRGRPAFFSTTIDKTGGPHKPLDHAGDRELQGGRHEADSPFVC
jgi:hypothetical protein